MASHGVDWTVVTLAAKSHSFCLHKSKHENKIVHSKARMESKRHITRIFAENAPSILRPLLEVYGLYFMLAFVLRFLRSVLNFANPQILEYEVECIFLVL